MVRAVNLTRLQTFVEVVRRGTFAAAADALAFTPSAVSQQMARLEAEVGSPLLERDAGGLQLTEAGGLLHAHALAIVGAVREARAGLDALRADQVRRLRIGACPVAAAAVLPRALRLLRRRLPGAELMLEEACADATARAVADGRLEVGVWVAPAAAGPSTEATCLDAAVVAVVLRRAPLVAALPAGHPLAARERLRADELGPALRWRVHSAPALLALVAAGEGHALMPAPAAEPLPAGVVLRAVAGAPEWELRAARQAGAVAAIGVQAAMEALRTAATPPRHRRVSTLSA